MKKIFSKKSLFFFLMVFFLLGVILWSETIFAQSLQPNCEGRACTFYEFLAFVRQVMNFLMLLAIPIAAALIAWAGVKILFGAGNPSKLSEAKEMMGKVALGFFFMLAAWLIVFTITNPILKDKYNVQQLEK